MAKEKVQEKFWHLRSVEEILQDMQSSKEGLSEETSNERRKEYGENKLAQEEGFKPFKILLQNFNNLLIYILFTASIISFLLEHYLEFYALLVIIILTVLLSFIQEYSASKAINALSKLSPKKIEVLRKGKKETIDASFLVPGDIILLKRGVIVPADCRVIESRSLLVDESLLTGESKARAKTAEQLKEQDLPLGDRINMLFSGSSVTGGDGKALVVKTASHTEIGKISVTLQSLEGQKSPLQTKVDQMSKQISFIILGIAFLLFFLLLYKGTAIPLALLIVGAVAVAGIPESFPLALTLTLSLGVKRMAKKNAVVKNLNSVETLGTTTVICTDKTGTLTENKMKVVSLLLPGLPQLSIEGQAYTPTQILKNEKGETLSKKELKSYERFFTSSLLCNEAELQFLNETWTLDGEATEGALLALGKSLHYDEEVLRETYKRVHEEAFDPEKKYMLTVHKTEKKTKDLVCLKGAVERVLEKCTHIRERDGKEKTLSSHQKKLLLTKIEEWTSSGLRVLAVGSKEIQSDSKKDLEKHLKTAYCLEGIVGIEDPLREDAHEAVQECKEAGVKVIMITGDHKNTARHIASQLGLLEGKRDEVIEGKELDTLNEEELEEKIKDVVVFARTSPEHKFRIVSALQKRGEIVAMTGDGVNDATALKKADIGVSMGKNGTEVAKEASDMVLLDDKFSTIVSAIREGRTIYSNIRRFIYYLLTVNFAQVGIVLLATILGFTQAMPLSPLMILFINMVTSTFPALALSVEPTHEKVMKQRPRNPKEPLLSRYILTKTLLIFPTMVIATLALFIWELRFDNSSLEKAMTIAFLVMVLTGLFHALNARSLHVSIFSKNFTKNPFVFLCISFSLFVTILTIYTVAGQALFNTEMLSFSDWPAVLLFGISPIVFAELIKLAIKNEFDEQSALRGLKAHLE